MLVMGSLMERVLKPFCPELTENDLQGRLSEEQNAQAQQQQLPRQPLTRKAAAELLSISLNTLNRYLNNGKLNRVYLSSHAVRVDAASIDNLLSTEESKK